MIDITERKRSEKLFDLLLKNVGSGILMTDTNGTVLIANDKALSLLGLDNRIIGHSLYDPLPEADKLLTRNLLGSRHRLRLEDASGRNLLLGFSNAEVELPEGNGLITVFRDISNLHQAEERRRRAEQLAQVGELAAKLSHEIKNPLATITAGLQLLESQTYLHAEDAMVVRTVIKEVKNISLLAQNMLDSARSDVLNPQIVTLCSFVGDVCDRYYSLAKKKSAIFRTDFSQEEIQVALDKKTFQRVLGNIINNAFEALGQGGVITVKIRVLTQLERQFKFPDFPGKVASIAVIDNGPGIPADQLNLVFQPFYTTKKTGTGLGLAVARDIVEFHGGVMQAASDYGRGSSITVYLPSGERKPCHEWGIHDNQKCAHCEIRESGLAPLCFASRMEEARMEGVDYPERCLQCSVFRASNLTYFY
ncbi:PAS domain S-box protein [candidate division KSB3 bacterium]|nr:PAS domain S-box protein [candidate division KSB3 bacterium]